MPLRFEAWTLPSSGTFEKKFDIPSAMPGSTGVLELSNWTDQTLLVPAAFSKLSDLVDETTGSLIKVFKGSDLIDEFDAARVDIPAGRPNTRTVSGPQRNGLIEGIGLAPKDYPNHKAGAMHWKWGAKNILPDLSLGALGSIREEWEVVLYGERYQLDLSSATAGTFTLTAEGNTTSAIDWDAPASSIASALEALAGISDVTVETTDDDVRTYWVVFDDPKDLSADMTADFGSLTGGGTLTKFNDGFNTASATFTITVDGQTTEAMDWDASANRVEGSATNTTGLQGLSNVNDVTVSGSGTFGDPWVIAFHDPADPAVFTVTFGAGTHAATKITEGALDPSPITKSKPVDAGAGAEEDHGNYGNPEIQVVTSPLATGAEWTLQVNAEARYAGSQIVLNVTPGETYSNITVPVYPEISGTYVLLIKDIFENMLAQTTPRDVPLSAGSYQTLIIPTFTVPDGINQVVMRVAVTSPSPSTWGVFYVSWETATFMEGDPEAPFTKIVRQLLDAAQDRGAGDWLELDATDTADTLGTVIPDISFTAFVGDNTNLSHVMDDGKNKGYQWWLAPAADAQVITPAGTTTHVLQVFKVDADEIEDLTASAGGPSVLTGSHVKSAQLVTRRIPFTTLIGLGTESVSVEDSDAAAEAGIGRIERVRDVEHLGSVASVQEYLDAQFAEQARNQKALTATVLESATKLPLVDYKPGSKIWWQFPGIHTKEARPVKRISWVHGLTAEFQVQGSRILTGEAAMASAMDMLLRRPGRRRDDKKAASPSSLASGGLQTGAHIHVMRASTQSIDAGSPEAIVWTLANPVHPAKNFPTISFPTSDVPFQEPGYYDIEAAFALASVYDGGGSVTILRNSSIIWPPSVDSDIWTTTSGRRFAGTAKGIELQSGDTIEVQVEHNDGSAVDLEWAQCSIELVDRITQREAWELVFAADNFGVTHDGTHWWTTDYESGVANALHKRSEDGTIIASFANYDLGSPKICTDLVYAAGFLWATGNDNANAIVKIDPADGTVDSRITSASTGSLGYHSCAYNGSNLFVTEHINDNVEEYTTAGSHVQNHSFPAGYDLQGLTWDGEHWWATTHQTSKILRMNSSFSVELEIDGPPGDNYSSSVSLGGPHGGIQYRNGFLYVFTTAGLYRKAV